MDGNRRWAEQRNMERSVGHTYGYLKLEEALEWCLELNVKIVTVYAFSIENFKRSSEEVNALMNLASEKFERLASEEGMIRKYGVRICVLGDWARLSPKLQKTMSKAVYMSRHNTRATLNICFAYTSRQEIVQAVQAVAIGVKEGILKSSDVSEDLLQRCFYTEDCPEPEILIRTSGETRLSDFLLWQCGYSLLCFEKALWPDFSVFHFAAVILRFQFNYSALRRLRDANTRLLRKRMHAADLSETRKLLKCCAPEEFPSYMDSHSISCECLSGITGVTSASSSTSFSSSSSSKQQQCMPQLAASQSETETTSSESSSECSSAKSSLCSPEECIEQEPLPIDMYGSCDPSSERTCSVGSHKDCMERLSAEREARVTRFLNSRRSKFEAMLQELVSLQ
eukprot:CAMPEP_0184663798 /NCGR_PEP_ID=MMETSP0308-20130426/49914_1 /TAXON_ID=38269 /ORGANISM="Gloeochaete witrockiana, Strain SAG 46.84" /LENGTH=396 /DNA_ID=CAMNT_0027106799 /DNA_START=126 /DNA_END=1316 /DNA_ORIENTATION=-